MGKNKIIILFLLLYISSFGQNNKAIEDDLMTLMDKITNSYEWVSYYKLINPTDTQWSQSVLNWEDSITITDSLFENKLVYYLNNFPSTLTCEFKDLTGVWKGNLFRIVTSSDSLFRIYILNDVETNANDWQTYSCVYQYKYGNIVKLCRPSTVNKDSNYLKSHEYDSIFTLKSKNKVYYIAKYTSVFSWHYNQEGFEAFTIENGELDDTVGLFKRGTGLYNLIQYGFDPELTDPIVATKKPTIYFVMRCKSIFMPVVIDYREKRIGLLTGRDQLTDKYIQYHFNGRYFEAVKN